MRLVKADLQVLLVSDGRFDDAEGVLVLETLARVVFSTITGGDFGLRYDDLRQVLPVGEDKDSGLTTFADDLFQLRRATGFDCPTCLPDDAGITESH